MEVDLLVTHPEECRYPFWELFVKKNRGYFRDVIISFTKGEITGKDYTDAVRESFRGKDVTFLYPPSVLHRDWRDHAVNQGLDHSRAKWVLFMEQDFFIGDLKPVFDYTGDVLGFQEDSGRLHPGFLLVRREVIEKTDRNFSAYPEQGQDHFDYFTSQLDTDCVKVLNPDCYYHMNGLTHNRQLLAEGKEIVYKPDEFLLYRILSSLVSDTNLT